MWTGSSGKELVSKLPKLPYQRCWENEKDLGVTNKTSQAHYTSLLPDKYQTVQQSILQYEKEMETNLAADPEFQALSYHKLSKTGLKMYLNALGCPPLPHLSLDGFL